MAVRPVLIYPDPKLMEPCAPVEDFGDATQAVIQDLFDTLRATPNAAAIAAPQLGHMVQIVVIDYMTPAPLVLVNPTITEQEGTYTSKEGCLSFPGVFVTTERAKRIHVTAQDAHGNPIDMDAEDELAKCIQHETEHVNGVLMTRFVSSMKLKMIRRKLASRRRG